MQQINIIVYFCKKNLPLSILLLFKKNFGPHMTMLRDHYYIGCHEFDS